MASDQQFCLRWNNHQSTLVSVFDNLLESQTLVDCTLAADGQYLKAHKVVLSACSPYLEAILCQNLDKHPILILKDVKFSELKAMLDYMYRGEVNISQEQLSTFLKAAESLQIKGLTDSGGGGGGSSDSRDRDLLKRQDLRKPLNQPVPHIPQPRPVVPHPGLLEPRRSLPHFPPHIADMQPQSPRHAREGSTSPTARKRRRPNRPSSDDSNFVSTPNSLSENQPDTSDSCDVPVKQSAPSTPSNVPNPSTKAPETDSPRTTPQPQTNSEQKQVVVKKEFSETLLTPKTEYDYGNDNSMEDAAYEDEEDEEVDLSKPGTSFATNSQGFPPWQMGDGSNDDSNNMYSPEVSAAANQNNSQDVDDTMEYIQSPCAAKSSKNITVQSVMRPGNGVQCFQDLQQMSPNKHKVERTPEEKIDNNEVDGDNIFFGKKGKCPKCGEYVLTKVMRLHSKYYCGNQFEEKEWKLCKRLVQCLRCKKMQEPDAIEFHVRYLCRKRQIIVQCFYCPRLFKDYRGLLNHTNFTHKKKHRYLDLLSILPVADSIYDKKSPEKIVKHFFNNSLCVTEEAFLEQDAMTSTDLCLQLRQKVTHTCEACGKELVGTHAYENHINTKCESEDHYSCFLCSFKGEFVYQVLDHMEIIHNKQFNTYDLLQAQRTGIIPIPESPTSENPHEELEIDFANQQLYEPYISPRSINKQIVKAVIKEEDSLSERGKKNGGEQPEQTQNVRPARNIQFKNKLRLKVPTKNLCNKIISQRNKRGKNVIKKPCPKCRKEIHPGHLRIHNKYHCGKEPITKQWRFQNNKAVCLKCKKQQCSETIDFHVKFLCRKKPFAMQCFYCDKISKEYKSMILHMKKGHNKSHYYQDLMSILPEPELFRKKKNKSGQSSKDEIQFHNMKPLKVVKHPFTYNPQIITEGNNSSQSMDIPANSLKFPNQEDFYSCFFCKFYCKAGYQVLDHIEHVHGKEYNTYDLLYAKMTGRKPTTGRTMFAKKCIEIVNFDSPSPKKCEVINGSLSPNGLGNGSSSSSTPRKLRISDGK